MLPYKAVTSSFMRGPLRSASRRDSLTLLARPCFKKARLPWRLAALQLGRSSRTPLRSKTTCKSCQCGFRTGLKLEPQSSGCMNFGSRSGLVHVESSVEQPWSFDFKCPQLGRDARCRCAAEPQLVGKSVNLWECSLGTLSW